MYVCGRSFGRFREWHCTHNEVRDGRHAQDPGEDGANNGEDEPVDDLVARHGCCCVLKCRWIEIDCLLACVSITGARRRRRRWRRRARRRCAPAAAAPAARCLSCVGKWDGMGRSVYVNRGAGQYAKPAARNGPSCVSVDHGPLLRASEKREEGKDEDAAPRSRDTRRKGGQNGSRPKQPAKWLRDDAAAQKKERKDRAALAARSVSTVCPPILARTVVC